MIASMTDAVTLAIYILAIARVTGLVTQDTITEEIRNRIIQSLDDRPKTLGDYLATLITCSWCAGMWVSAIVVPIAYFHHSNTAMLLPALVLAVSQAVGMSAQVGR